MNWGNLYHPNDSINCAFILMPKQQPFMSDNLGHVIYEIKNSLILEGWCKRLSRSEIITTKPHRRSSKAQQGTASGLSIMGDRLRAIQVMRACQTSELG